MKPFILYPAIDLRNGLVVRLEYGDPDRQTIFGDNPVEIGRRWIKAGATWLHVINLDGAFGEKSAANWQALEGIALLGAQVQFGGGIRTLDDIERARRAGAARIILGTVAVEQPEIVSEALEKFGPDHIAVGIDAWDNEVKTRGWLNEGGISPLELAQQMAELGVRTIIHTDISRDGVLSGVNAEGSAEIAEATGLDVIASGGVASLNDIQRSKAFPLAGVITGRAIYDGTFQLEDALKMCSKQLQ